MLAEDFIAILHDSYFKTVDMISVKFHAILDYLMAVLLIAAPWLFGFSQGEAETTTPVMLGIITIIYSLLTKYRYGIIKVISFSSHLMMDASSGIFLATSPWIVGFHDYVYLPHLILGLTELAVVLFTKKSIRLLKKQHNYAHRIKAKH